MLEFSWQSFAFALINFLILVWLLCKFLHRPLLSVLKQRREGIEKARGDIEAEMEKLKAARTEYETKLAAAATERDELLVEARKTVEQTRKEMLEKATAEAERDVARLKQAWEQEQRSALKDLQDDISNASIEIARRVLLKTADTDLHRELMERLVNELDELKAGERKTPGKSLKQDEAVRVVSAVAPGKSEQAAAEKSIRAIAGDAVEIAWQTDPDLVAGARVEFGSISVDSSLADILAAVREQAAAAEEPGAGKEDESR